ncbi:putative O-methyltransferase YrrM [Methylobacterium sp. OAE515]|uniref:O-methyltransferase n=1 Tax=Methylobacterium sp. OAE515 TaxID=2817895 RepID=UPI00178A0A60
MDVKNRDRYEDIALEYRKKLDQSDPSVRGMTSNQSRWPLPSEIISGNTESDYTYTMGFIDYIDQFHRDITTCPLGRNNVPFQIDYGINGFLQRDEALKLYEMAYYAAFRGHNILELGTNEGLSSFLMATALKNHSNPEWRKVHIDTVDISPEWSASAQKTMRDRELSDYVNFHVGDATEFLDQRIAEGSQYGVAFIDHWHGYDTTFEAASRLADVLVPGGFALFHDFSDPNNFVPDHPYAVYQGVCDTILKDDRYQFFGLFGSIALFRVRPH